MATQEHDLVVIGAGPGGYVAAIRAAQLGWNVGCVEQAPALGGTCLRLGCIPSKVLLESSELYALASQRFAAHGIQCAGLTLDLATLMRRKDQVVTLLSRGVESLFKKHRITRYTGRGRLEGPGRVSVQNGAQSTELKAKHILLATGSKPASLPGLELDGQRIGTSTEALAYAAVPKHLVVIGAGYIGLELGSVWRRLGAKVTFLEFLDRILPGVDDELAADAKKLFEKQGLEFRLGVKVTSARAQGEQCVVQTERGEPVVCDQVLVAAGRQPNTEGLGLESLKIELDAKGRIAIDDHFATSVPGVYAIGDVVRGPMLAHKAEEEAVACIEHLVTGYGHVDYNTIPGVVYTDPEIAAVGKTETELREQGREYRKGVFPFRANGRAHSLGQVEGKIKMLADRQTDRILGVHILGPRAGDLIAEAVTGMALGASSEDLARICHAHPTLSEALKEAALAVDNRTIHL
jgi:dihydrolipoamide dehydrogenase